MTEEREQCAVHAIGEQGDAWALTPADLLATENGHHYHHGWHIGWTWSAGGDGVYLDFLSEHRMTSMHARRVFPDGSVERLDTPDEMRRVGDTPEEDERLQREYFEHNRRAYASLRERGLLPEFGANTVSQDINEYLRSGNADGV